MNLNVNQADIDNRLLAGDIQVDAQALGLGAAAKARVLADPTLKANSDAALTGRAWFAYLNTKVAPLTNLACRKAVEYAVDKQSVQTAWGGPVAGGQIASTVMSPTIRRLPEVRPVRRAVQADRRPHRGQAAARAVRPAERLQHQPVLPF